MTVIDKLSTPKSVDILGRPDISGSVVKAYIDNLVKPVIDIIKYYPDREFERRTLLFTWAANLFKPVAAVEASKILGYDYKNVRELFMKLAKSSVLVGVADGAKYCRVVLDGLQLYVRKDVIIGSKLSGRPPKLYVFQERQAINMNDFIWLFNQNSTEVWASAAQKILDLACTLDTSYKKDLLEDYFFLKNKIGPVIRSLRDYRIVFLERKGDRAQLTVPLRGEKACYNIPSAEPFKSLI